MLRPRMGLLGTLAALTLVAFGCAPAASPPAVPTPNPAAAAPTPTPVPAWKPEKPITIIVPASAGGGLDITARLFAKTAEKYVGQPLVIENRPAGTTVVGTTALANAKPDGYTLGTTFTNVVLDPYLIKSVPFNYSSFTPIAQVSTDAPVMVVRKGGPLDKPFKEIVAEIKANPGKFRAGVGGTWSSQDFGRAQFEKASGTKLVRVPFAGGAPVVAALLAGDVDVSFNYPTEFQAQKDKLRPVAVASDSRLSSVPDVPTFKEQGYDVSFELFRMISGPAGLPQPVVAYLHDAFKKTMDDPQLKADFEKAGVIASYLSASDSVKRLREEDGKFKKLVQDLGIEAK